MIELNYLGIVIVVVLSLCLGAFWYSPILFGGKWMALMGKGEKDLNDMKRGVWKMYSISFIGSLILSFVLDLLVEHKGANTFFEGALLGIIVWIGFIVPANLGPVLFENRQKGLFFISMGYYLVMFFVGGGILASF